MLRPLPLFTGLQCWGRGACAVKNLLKLRSDLIQQVMSYTGKVKNGVVVLPPEIKLPDGIEVQVTLPDPPPMAIRRSSTGIKISSEWRLTFRRIWRLILITTFMAIGRNEARFRGRVLLRRLP